MISKDMLITDILAEDPDIAGILMAKGMHCISCMAAAGETLEQAMYVHGYDDADIDVTIAQINDFLKGGEESAAE